VARTPLRNSHWIEPGRLLAGEHPSGEGVRATKKRIGKLVDAGIDSFLDLTEPGELESYEPLLVKAVRGREIAYLRRPIRDHGLPDSDAAMREILEALEGELAAGRTVYLHCRAGIGRTNLVAGCWMANRHGAGAIALEELNRRWRDNARSRTWPIVPETTAQADFVRGWPRPVEVASPVPVAPAATPGAANLRDRVRGMLLGLAAGDALGHAIHGLPTGAWSDKTAMALCLAESLVSQDGPDAADQVARYCEWQRAGFWSSTGSCVGISAATTRALAAAQWSGNPYAGSHDPAHADAEPLARIGPAVAWFHASPGAGIDAAVNAARVTHQAPLTLDSVRFLAALLAGALAGTGKDELLSADFSPDPATFDPATLRPPLRELAAGAWRGRRPRRMLRGKLVAVAALESALAAFEGSDGLVQCLEAAASRPGDAATAAAIAGQVAGAYYGALALPPEMRAALARADEIEALADRLVDASPVGTRR
jgi:ADP-ribosyl-[dinitrogen reductase] hydrolase